MVKKTSFKFVCLSLLLIIFIFVSLEFVSSIAFTIQSVSPGQIVNRTAYTVINFTLNNTGPVTNVSNISRVTITFPMETRFAANSNSTSAANTLFLNTTGGFPPRPVLIWANTAASGFMAGSQLTNFSFNASLTRVSGSAFFANFTVAVNYTNGTTDETSYTFVVNFAFRGYVKNETGNATANVNVSIYQFALAQNGPPTEIIESSTLTDADGYFNFASLNGSATLYTLKMVAYTPAGCTRANATCNASKVGSSLPSFPPEMYYPMSVGNEAFAFMIPPTLNGTNFYLQPAATLRLYAHNSTIAQRFGYEIIDQAVGFPVESNFKDNASTKDIIIPTGRNYTVIYIRAPNFAGGNFVFDNSCNGASMNDTTCPIPPISNSSYGTLTEGQITTINQSLVVSQYRLYGCINISTGVNNSAINVTNIIPKMVPWTGFVPPIKGDMGNLNVADTSQLNRTNSSGQIDMNGKIFCPAGYVAGYNISVIGSAGGINYLMEFYGKNASNEAGNPGNAFNLGAFQNVTITGNTMINITLRRLAGSYLTNQTDANTSKVKINIQNSSGGAITNNMNANIKIKHPVTGTITYIVETMSSGTFYMPILNNSNWAKIMVYANDAPPKEITLNLSLSENNITLVTMMDGKGIGMKRINSSGQMDMINTTYLNSTKAINMRFLRNSAECNVLNPPINCQITSMGATDFNPLTALIAGKINMEMKITSTNTTLTFMNFDMFAAKQPPMDSIMDDQAKSGASTANQVWQFGSFAPVNTYDYVVIGMPYSDSIIDDSRDVNLSVPFLYDENWNEVWNSSRGDTSANLTDDFLDYNSTALYRNYLTANGVNCSKNDPNLNVTPCLVNTTSNTIYMRIPHFSGIGPNIAGSAPAAATSTTTASPSSSGTTFWINTQSVSEKQFTDGYTQQLAKKYRVQVSIDKKFHYIGVIDLSSTTATINISSKSQQAVFNIGDEKKFDVTEDGYYDVSVKLNSIANNKANITIRKINEKVTEFITAAPEPTTETTVPAPEPQGEVSSEKPKSSPVLFVVIIIAIIVIIVLVAISFLMKKTKKNKVQQKIKVFDF